MIKFKSTLPEVKKNFPIISAKEFKFDWIRAAAISFKDAVKQNTAVTTGVARCSGIREIISTGFILTSWFDFSMLTSDDPITFQYSVPAQDQYSFDLIKWFSNDVLQVKTPLPSASLQSLIKITTPWTVELPDDWSLLIVPIPYPDQPEFESTMGILKGPGTYEINPIIKIHSKPGLLRIPAGTPLCQLIFLKNEICDIEID